MLLLLTADTILISLLGLTVWAENTRSPTGVVPDP